MCVSAERSNRRRGLLARFQGLQYHRNNTCTHTIFRKLIVVSAMSGPYFCWLMSCWKKTDKFLCFVSYSLAVEGPLQYQLMENDTELCQLCQLCPALHANHCSLLFLDRRRFSRQGMDGRYYHHYSSSDRMWYMPEHPGPYPSPAEPPSLEQLEIAPPHAEPPLSPVIGEVSRTARECMEI